MLTLQRKSELKTGAVAIGRRIEPETVLYEQLAIKRLKRLALGNALGKSARLAWGALLALARLLEPVELVRETEPGKPAVPLERKPAGYDFPHVL